MNGKPTVISVFAGCGGSSLGYQMAGYKELLAIEWEANAAETFKLNFPEVPIWQKDICLITADEILDYCNLEIGGLDLLDGSPPCQGFSTAGKRRVNDSRNDLFKEFIRLIDGLQPRIFVMENVSGMIKGKLKGRFIEIMKSLKATGYQVKCKLMNTMWYGVPQNRQRLIFIGIRKDLHIEPSYPSPNKQIITVGKALQNCCDIGKPLTPEAAKYWYKMKPGETASKYHPKGYEFGLVKLDPDKPAPTLTGHAGCAKPVHWIEERFIGIKERSLLSSYPVGFQWYGSWIDIYNGQGNSVPPQFMKAIAEHIKESILANAVLIPADGESQ